MRHIESRIQSACKKWFDLHFPELTRLLFAIPNGGRRGKIEASIMKSEGVVAGAPDMILLYPTKAIPALCLEFKTEDGWQSRSQREWQKSAENQGYRYVIVRSLEQFIKLVQDHIYNSEPWKMTEQ